LIFSPHIWTWFLPVCKTTILVGFYKVCEATIFVGFYQGWEAAILGGFHQGQGFEATMFSCGQCFGFSRVTVQNSKVKFKIGQSLNFENKKLNINKGICWLDIQIDCRKYLNNYIFLKNVGGIETIFQYLSVSTFKSVLPIS